MNSIVHDTRIITKHLVPSIKCFIAWSTIAVITRCLYVFRLRVVRNARQYTNQLTGSPEHKSSPPYTCSLRIWIEIETGPLKLICILLTYGWVKLNTRKKVVYRNNLHIEAWSNGKSLIGGWVHSHPLKACCCLTRFSQTKLSLFLYQFIYFTTMCIRCNCFTCFFNSSWN